MSRRYKRDVDNIYKNIFGDEVKKEPVKMKKIPNHYMKNFGKL